MNDFRGHINVYLKLMDSSFYRDSDSVHLWVHLLMKALKKPRKVNFKEDLYDLKRGQIITTITLLGDETNIERSKVQRILNKFKEEQMVKTSVPTNRKGAILTIVNYDKYQPKPEKIDGNIILTEEQLDTIMRSWKKVQPETFEYRGRYSVGMISKHRDKISKRSLSAVRSHLAMYGTFLTDELSCERIVEEDEYDPYLEFIKGD